MTHKLHDEQHSEAGQEGDNHTQINYCISSALLLFGRQADHIQSVTLEFSKVVKCDKCHKLQVSR